MKVALRSLVCILAGVPSIWGTEIPADQNNPPASSALRGNTLPGDHNRQQLSIYDCLKAARFHVMAGTQAGERAAQKMGTNYQTARGYFEQAYTNILNQEKLGKTNIELRATISGEYGWFLYRSGFGDSGKGKQMVLSALRDNPGSANLNAKIAMINFAQFATSQSRSPNSPEEWDRTALEGARNHYERALAIDPNYGYGYFGLSQIYTDSRAWEFRQKFTEHSNHMDLELWLYDQSEFDSRLKSARAAIKERQN